MAQLHTIRGTWDELALRAEELRSYGELTLIIPAETQDTGERLVSSDTDATEANMADLFAGRVGRLSFGPSDLAARAETYFGQLIDAKRNQPEVEE